jgi:hypothetical protein
MMSSVEYQVKATAPKNACGTETISSKCNVMTCCWKETPKISNVVPEPQAAVWIIRSEGTYSTLGEKKKN